MGGSSSSTTTSSVAAANPQLNNLFTSLFTGGLGGQISSTLGSIMSGGALTSNTTQLYKTLSQATQPQYQQGMAGIKEQMARSGLTNSTSLSGVTGGYTAQYLGNLSNIATQMGLQETSMQGSVAGGLMQMLASAGSQYYTNKSTTLQTMPWTQGFSAIMSGLSDVAGMFSGTGALADLNPYKG